MRSQNKVTHALNIIHKLKDKITTACTWIIDLVTTPTMTVSIGKPFFWCMRLGSRKKAENDIAEKNILIVRLDEIGDIVLTTPFIRELRHNYPHARITLVVKPSVYELVAACPYVNEIQTFDWHVTGRWSVLRRHIRACVFSLKYLLRRRFDMAIVPRWDCDYYYASYICYLSGARRRIGYAENCTDIKKTYNKGYDRLYTDVISDTEQRHEVQKNLEVVRRMGGTVWNDRLELWIDKKDDEYAAQLLASRAIPADRPVFAIGIGARSKKRVWPSDRYSQLAKWLQERFECSIVICGGSDDARSGMEINNVLGDQVINLIGKTTLSQMAAIMKRCSLFIGNDAGPMHIAAAAGIPVIEISCHARSGSISHYNSPVRFGPWGVPCRVLQPDNPVAPCVNGCEADSPHCIKMVPVKQVQDAIVSLLNECGRH